MVVEPLPNPPREGGKKTLIAGLTRNLLRTIDKRLSPPLGELVGAHMLR